MYENIFVVDVEATSKTPMTGVMTEFGVVHMVSGRHFYGHLYWAESHPDIPALPVVKLDAHGKPFMVPFWQTSDDDDLRWSQDLKGIALAVSEWVESFNVNRPTLVSDNNGFDAMWFNCLLDSQHVDLVFGHSSRRIGDFYAGKRAKWNDQSSWKKLRKTKHTHNPVDDAKGNAEALRALLNIS